MPPSEKQGRKQVLFTVPCSGCAAGAAGRSWDRENGTEQGHATHSGCHFLLCPTLGGALEPGCLPCCSCALGCWLQGLFYPGP